MRCHAIGGDGGAVEEEGGGGLDLTGGGTKAGGSGHFFSLNRGSRGSITSGLTSTSIARRRGLQRGSHVFQSTCNRTI